MADQVDFEDTPLNTRDKQAFDADPTEVDKTNRRVVVKGQSTTNQESFTGTGPVVSSFDVKSREFLSVEVKDVDETNQIDIQARLTGGTFETIWTIIGETDTRAVNISKWDEIQVECVIFDATTGNVRVTSHDANHKEDFENIELSVTEGGITYTGTTKEEDAAPSHPVWRMKREYTSQGQTVTQYADGGNFTQVFDDRLTIFPPAPLIEVKSTLHDGVNEFITIPADASHNFDGNSQPFTFLIWCKRLAGGNRTLFSNLNIAQPTLPGIAWYCTTTSMNVLLENDNTTGNLISVNFTTAMPSGVWHFCAFTNDGSGLASGVKCYHNANNLTPSVVTDALTGSTAGGNPMLMGNALGGTIFFPFLGNLNDSVILNVELTQAEITEAYNNGKAMDMLNHSRVLADPTTMPYYGRHGDAPGDVITSLKNLGNAGATLDAVGTNMESSDIVLDAP